MEAIFAQHMDWTGVQWVGTLNSKASMAGLAAYKAFFQAASKASKTTIETRPNPYDVYARGDAASMIGPSWFTCCVGDSYKASTAQFVMPGHVKGTPMPGGRELPRRPSRRRIACAC